VALPAWANSIDDGDRRADSRDAHADAWRICCPRRSNVDSDRDRRPADMQE
jgi:hypothetical protein